MLRVANAGKTVAFILSDGKFSNLVYMSLCPLIPVLFCVFCLNALQTTFKSRKQLSSKMLIFKSQFFRPTIPSDTKYVDAYIITFRSYGCVLKKLFCAKEILHDTTIS